MKILLDTNAYSALKRGVKSAIRHNFTLLTNDQHFLPIKGLSLECIQ